MQKNVGMVKEAYISDIRNRTTNLVNDTVAGVLTYLQENYGQFIPHELLYREEIVKETNYGEISVFST